MWLMLKSRLKIIHSAQLIIFVIRPECLITGKIRRFKYYYLFSLILFIFNDKFFYMREGLVLALIREHYKPFLKQRRRILMHLF